MRERTTNGRTDAPTPAGGRQGDTTMAQGENQAPSAARCRTSATNRPTASRPASPPTSASGKVAQADVERGVADTTKGAELDATYDQLREDLPDGEKKFRP